MIKDGQLDDGGCYREDYVKNNVVGKIPGPSIIPHTATEYPRMLPWSFVCLVAFREGSSSCPYTVSRDQPCDYKCSSIMRRWRFSGDLGRELGRSELAAVPSSPQSRGVLPQEICRKGMGKPFFSEDLKDQLLKRRGLKVNC